MPPAPQGPKKNARNKRGDAKKHGQTKIQARLSVDNTIRTEFDKEPNGIGYGTYNRKLHADIRN